MLLPLPISPETVLREILPAAMAYLPPPMRSPEADLELLAMSMQESGLNDRRQGTTAKPGPARGLLQFELGGVRGVMENDATRELLRTVCVAMKVPYDARAMHLRCEEDDVFCFVLGRLNLWTDPWPLPAIGDWAEAFACYVRVWRPGAARTPEGLAKCRTRWRRNYTKALAAVKA